MKIRRNITVDADVWELAKIKISEPLSCYIQKQLEIACNLSDDKLEIEKALYEKEQEITALRSQLYKLEKEEQLKKVAGYDIEKCLVPINRIYNHSEVIGENQICRIARNYDVDCNELIRYCKLKGYNVVQLFEFNKEGSGGNGSGLR